MSRICFRIPWEWGWEGGRGGKQTGRVLARVEASEEFVEGYAMLYVDKFEILGNRVFKNCISVAVPRLVFLWPFSSM